jgi:prophage regulatory protein
MSNLKLMKISQVMNLTALSRSTIYQLMAEAKFPKQVVLSVRSVAWVASEVEDWIMGKIEIRDA